MPGGRGLGTTRDMAAELPVVLDVLSNDLESCFLEKKATISSFDCCSIHISSGKPAISIHFFPRDIAQGGSTLASRIM